MTDKIEQKFKDSSDNEHTSEVAGFLLPLLNVLETGTGSPDAHLLNIGGWEVEDLKPRYDHSNKTTSLVAVINGQHGRVEIACRIRTRVHN